MLRIVVVSLNGVPPERPLAAEFGEGVGSIGREDHNTLVLPDPHKHISRVQAQIKCLAGEYFLVDQGGNPTCVNGRPLGKGNVAALHDGDSIEMAEWILRAEQMRTAPMFSSAAVPGAATDPLGLLGESSVGDRPRAAAMPPAVPTPELPVPKAGEDPFAVFSVAAKGPAADAVPPTRETDPFAAFGVPAAQAEAVPQVPSDDQLGLGIARSAPGSLDALFGLDRRAAPDPFANSPLVDPQSLPPVSAATDPLAVLLGTAPALDAPAARNDAPLLRDAFVPPVPQPAEEEFDFNLPTRVVSGMPDSPAPAAPAAAPVVSWGRESGFVPEPQPMPETAPDLVSQASPMESRVESHPAARVSVERPAEPRTRQPVADSAPGSAPDAMLSAFLRGLGVPSLNLSGGLTPELVEHVGVMLREAVQGTVELLAARAATKREVRAEMTMIVSQNNNPLKFSPDVNFALYQLLQPQGSKGFMPPMAAMRDAYDDLRAHQIGFIAGMRAALAGVLGRFKPEELEARLADKSFLDSVLPANRKAKLWDLYEQRYADIQREAEDDFHSLFGREFLRAYEEQIERLQDDRVAPQ